MTAKCYMIFNYAWHLSGVKPVRNYFKSFASLKEAGEFLFTIFSRDLDEGIFGTLLPEEELDAVKAAAAQLNQDFIVNQNTDSYVKLDLSCFEFQIHAICVWPDGAQKILETVVEILQKDFAGQSEFPKAEADADLDDNGFQLIYQKALALLGTETSSLDREKFDEIFDYMARNHSSKGVFK